VKCSPRILKVHIYTRRKDYAKHATTHQAASSPDEKKVRGIVTSFNSENQIDVSNGKIKNGKWKEFNKHAILIAEGCYLNNKKHGLWKEYYDHTGSIMIEEIYENGFQHGRFASFHPNGQLMSEGKFDRGLREGWFRVYDENGNNIRNLLFVNDIQVEDTEGPVHSDEEQRKREAC